MKKVMVDNWLMEDVICNYDRKGISESYGNVLSALVLWDEIQFPTNERDFWKHVNIPDDRWAREVEILRQNIKPIDDVDELFDKERRSFFRCNKDIFDESITEVVGVGAMRYLSLSNYLGLDYLPCEKRREFMHRYPDICRESFNRINSLKPLDSEIEKVIDEITQEFGSCFLTISRPVLVDYIRDNTPKDMTYVEFALKLRKTRPVIQYRRLLNDIETNLNKGNIREVNKLREYSKEMVRDIVKIKPLKYVSANFNVLALPSLSVPTDIRLPRGMHLTFLEDLIDYSFYGKRLGKM